MIIKTDLLAEHLNRILYQSRSLALKISRLVSGIAALVGMAILLYLFGFIPSPEQAAISYLLIDVLLLVFLFSFLLRWLYAFRRTDFIKQHRLEGILMLLILFREVDRFLLSGQLLEEVYGLFVRQELDDFYKVFVSLLFLSLLLLEFSRLSGRLDKLQVSPSRTFLFSFVLLIAVGTLILMLPAMTTQEGSMHWLDALFTSVSASCVTGLIVVDTAEFFTFRGQLVILALIQTGGLGMLAFATFFASFMNSGIGFRQKMMIPDYLDNETLASSRDLLRQIVFITFFIEFGTFILLFATWGVTFDSLQQKVFFSVFHAVSAFCNAGFSLFTDGLYEEVVRNNYILHMVIAVSLILGSLGFAPIKDIFSPRNLRDRLEHPWKNWMLSTRIAFNMTVILLVAGTLLFFWLEQDNTLADKNLSESLISSFFQSATTRTAGFNTVDFSQVATPTLIIMMILMFIGGSSGSTAGGIKTSTFFLLLISVVAISKGRSRVQTSDRYIPNEVIFKALSVFFYGIAINAIIVFLLSVTEKEIDIINLLFEQVSAFGTVGLSTGITASLSSAGKGLIIISMFLGRVGTLTFAVALSTRIASQNYKLPTANLMVG